MVVQTSGALASLLPHCPPVVIGDIACDTSQKIKKIVSDGSESDRFGSVFTFATAPKITLNKHSRAITKPFPFWDGHTPDICTVLSLFHQGTQSCPALSRLPSLHLPLPLYEPCLSCLASP